ncbi:undecaprenyl-phosphate galactose phosphotransferase/putative colanic acid biosynthesis UDP-glucose lipid carrier transferase [Mucilaginibacter frigoritolerans]|jgi:putative colanic acid biosysnthesis UDP-glucose lipid carrier transferase|uniref:Undecaprenyl-phosphate galactose phosphotransferase/putative colanic acid biosynthesis UDP-glucose lipid carrier transferase n=1 Tax=Mucilaginibacter frigoritolerans TaxID=652788 RepID=A0A562UFP5_9SPHI|nr:undecaprenyl-phosphate glucose phosphotransferase [Mucilaginibacter frigoritolerans]TWJ04640.1 undecaprenyl-phosphate galactose phosphotransferase/putative colanic acid biosynthesis UDP-glucose lipid carrier transferase [Mucilaginibacter frigoritolerans]
MINRHTTFFKALNLATDYLILNISMISTYFIEDKSTVYWVNNRRYLPIVLVFNLIWLLSANISGLYEQVLNRDSIKTYRVVIKTYLLFVSFICFTILILIGTEAYFITRQYLFYSLALFGFLLGFWKLIFLLMRKSERASLIDARDIIIVGAGRIGYDLYNFFKQNPDAGYVTLGFFDDNPENIRENNLFLGGTDKCIEYVMTNKVDEIFCTLPLSESKTIEKLMLDADKNLIRFKFVPEYYDYAKKPTYIQSFGHIPIISVRTEPLENLLNRSIKRFFDIVFSLFVIVFVFSWLFPILALIIKLESRGPVFFTQIRSGRDNNPFKCYKFRSMRVNNDADQKQATRNDQRITKTGAFLRRTSLDELPQFFNVLGGNMSVVGPRPHMISHTSQYSKLIDRFMVRHFLKPGITGWAQIKGLRGETKTVDAMLKRVEADVWYLENWSFLLDLKIVFLTVRNSLKGDENAF